MKFKLLSLVIAGAMLLTIGLFTVVAAGNQDKEIIKGGLIYDKWWKALKVDEPVGDHPLWATQDTNTRSGVITWRCKECHGWDYKGADGVYGSGSHFTGFTGVYDTRTKSVEEIVAALKGETNPDHDFSAVMDDEALNNLAIFIQNIDDYSQYINYETKAPIKADADKGKQLFEGDCADCHGDDGRDIDFGGEFVGTLAVGNPQEFLHKAIYGHPGSKPRMKGRIKLGWTMEQIVDVWAHAQTLPTGEDSSETKLAAAAAIAKGKQMIKGGLAYDKWWKALRVDEPVGDQPLWATQDTNARSGVDTWRCKECHGWDYKGTDGAYGSGSHFTDFPGVYDARTKSVEEIVAALKGKPNPDHDFSAVMDDETLGDLAVFIQNIDDYSQYIDYKTKTPIKADADNGKLLFEGDCADCHGDDGTEIDFGGEFVGTLAVGNPQEFLHKANYGHPGSKPRMKGRIQLGWTVEEIVDVLAHAQTLPTGEDTSETATTTATAGEGFEYIVQADDWLSKLAEKHLADVKASSNIVEATNAKHNEDASFAQITDPDIIEIGWKLWIPVTVK